VKYDLITTGRPDLTAFAERYGYLRGARLDKLGEYETRNISVDFIDMHWEDPDFPAHLKACKRHRPKYAVAGDYDGENFERVHDRARQLRECVGNVIVVPHSPGEVPRVPEWCVVGYSSPSEYAGTTAPVWEYRGRDVHILGGTPHQQLEILAYLGDDVVSLDCNSHHKAATIGAKAWYSESPHWRKVEDEQAVETAYQISVENMHQDHQQRGFVAATDGGNDCDVQSDTDRALAKTTVLVWLVVVVFFIAMLSVLAILPGGIA